MSSDITAGLQARLAGDATLAGLCPGGVFVWPAPLGVTQPFITVEMSSARDEGCGGGPRLSEVIYEVAAVAPASQVATARQAAARIDALLDYQQGWTLTGYQVSGCRRTALVDSHEEDGSQRWVTLGGEYALWVART